MFRWSKIVLTLLFGLLLIVAIIPSNFIPLYPFVLFLICFVSAVVIIVHAVDWNWYVVFGILFIFAVYSYSVEKGYKFGSDDSFYYSYVASVVIDHDLDLTNQYHDSGLPPKFLEVKTPIGAVENVFPIGASFLWLPFFLIAELLAWMLNIFGAAIPMNGYS